MHDIMLLLMPARLSLLRFRADAFAVAAMLHFHATLPMPYYEFAATIQFRAIAAPDTPPLPHVTPLFRRYAAALMPLYAPLLPCYLMLLMPIRRC